MNIKSINIGGIEYGLYIKRENKPDYTGAYLIRVGRLRKFNMLPGMAEVYTDELYFWGTVGVERERKHFVDLLLGYEPVTEEIALEMVQNGFPNMTIDTPDYRTEVIEMDYSATFNSDW